VVAVLAEVPAARAQMVAVVARGAARQAGPGESVCACLRKRGPMATSKPPPRWNEPPGLRPGELFTVAAAPARTDLVHPDVTIHVEVPGLGTLIGAARATGPLLGPGGEG
jgi:hypothetical protein